MNEPSTKTIIVDPQSAPQIRLGFELYATGIYSLEQVVTQLNEKGLSTCKQNLSNVLKNPFCTGKIRLDAWKDEPEQIINGLYEALITKEVFNTCQNLFNGKRKKLSRLTTRQENLPLRGHLRCAKCGGKLTGSNSKSRNSSLHAYYHCQKGCKERFRVDDANEIFIQFLQFFEINDEVQELYVKILADVFKTNDADRNTERQRIEKQIQELNNRIECK